ncbi:hypothetical protein CLV68_6001 [Actinokineospora cianjurensis]|uniref:Uncharacterized protein n=1 Tax=Actinokineospora cianjurensis TaxID=585224 RepID=A0A421AXC7_9PSEU|nr:hypothetical protein CLV68_6001 [Actinokineospora cianjurensis]
MKTTKPNVVHQAIDLKRCEGVWTCDDLSELVPDVPVRRRFPTMAALLDDVFRHVAERELYHMKRDGSAEIVIMLLEPTFEVLAKNIRFRYLVKHGQDPNTKVIVVQSWLRPLER